MEYIREYVKTVHLSAHEVIDYFFDDPALVKGMLKLEEPVCPASLALYEVLAQKDGLINRNAEFTLKSANFCRKAIVLLPRMFDMRAPLIVPRLKEIMACARADIDKLGNPLARVDEKSSNKRYGEIERIKLIKMREEEYRRYEGLEKYEIAERIERKYASNDKVRELRTIVNNADDEALSSPYQNKYKDALYELSGYDIEKLEEIAKTYKNIDAVKEMKKVLDFNAWIYKGVILAPSVVNMNGDNPKLFKANQEVVRDEFALRRDYIELYRQDLYENFNEC